MKGFKLFLLCSLFIYPLLDAQSNERFLTYNIKALGMNLGQFTVKQICKDGVINVEGITDIKVQLLLSYQVKYIQETTHKNGHLIKSHLQTRKNGEVNSDTWMLAQVNDYLLIKDGDSTLIQDSINYTGSLLYFHEPVNVQYLYKEKSGDKRIIKLIGEHTYALVDEKGHTTHEYTYQDGILSRAKIKYPLADIYLEYCQ